MIAMMAVVAVAVVGCSPVSNTVQTESPTMSPTLGSSAVRPLLVVIGNSFVGGSAMDSGAAARWPALVSSGVGADVEVISADASGYVNPGEGDRTYLDLAEQVPADASVVIVMGSDDDAQEKPDAIRSAAVVTLRTVIDRAPGAALIVVSTPWVEIDPNPGIVATRDSVRAASETVGAVFVDALADGWLVTGPPGQIGSDGLHPTDVGHRRIADALIPVVRDALARR